MVDQVKIDLQDNSPYRVALELAVMIAKAEHKLGVHGPSGDRKYWLDLYARCFKVVKREHSAELALKGSTEPESSSASMEPDDV